MMASFTCPLDPFNVKSLWSNQRNFALVIQEIENHISSSSCFHPPLKDIVLHGSLDGSTFLLLACQQGDVNSVQHIVDVWGVDVRTAANFYNSREKIVGATPLFVAVLYGHDEVAQYLISKGADVSAIASVEGKPGDITPLLAAVKYTRFGAGKKNVDVDRSQSVMFHLLLEAGANPSTLDEDGDPLWCGCGVYSTIVLIDNGIDLDLRDSRGRTILHHWIDLASIALYVDRYVDEKKLLIDGARLLLDRGVDLHARDSQGFTAMLKTAHELKNTTFKRNGSSILLGIFELMLAREIDPTEKIDALELAGAQLLLEPLDVEEAFRCWREALRLRENGKKEKIPLQTSGEAAEWVTREQLEDAIQDPSVHCFQSMLTRLRIYSGRGSFDFFLIHEFAHIFRENNLDNYYVQPTITQLLDLALVILELFRLLDPQKKNLSECKQKLTADFANNLPSTIENDEPLSNVALGRIQSFFQLILPLDPEGRSQFGYQLFALLAGLPDVLLREEIKNYFSKSARRNVLSLLASACVMQDFRTLRFLYHLQAYPNAFAGGIGPLHLVDHQLMLGNDDLFAEAKCKMIKTTLQFILSAVSEEHLPHTLYGYTFFSMLADMPEILLEEKIRKFASKKARLYQTILLVEAFKRNDTKTIRLLLHLRVDPNLIIWDCLIEEPSDEPGNPANNRPLHIVATQDMSTEVEHLGNLLFQYGAQPSRKNNEGKTAVDIWIEKNCGGEGTQSPKWNHRPSWCRNTAPRLTCLAGKTIHTYGISYSRLPVKLLHFVEEH